MKGDLDALHNRLADSLGLRVDARCRSGVGAIGVFIPLVRKVPIRGRWRDVLLFRQLSAMHDDVVRDWRVLL
jgi:hypothetical protein